ncbi:MAG: sigma-54 dependent transcriptional regulator [Ignavibacteriaceae bacterium]
MNKILIIDDDKSIRDTLSLFLSEFDYKILSAGSGEEGLAVLDKERPELILCDLKLPRLSGLDFLKKLNEYDSRIPVIIMTAYGDSRTTIKAIQLGAYDYIEKPLDVDRLNVLIKRALEERRISEHLEITISKDSDEYRIENSLISKTPVMKEVLKKIGKVSSNRVSVLIHGESGTGKELITKVIHYTGITRHSPFIAVNCTALSESLLESELFGHEKGSFTGAIRDKKGKFELAGEGTIFLDEISEISPNLQVKLLRVLQEKEFERVGGENTIPMQARIVAATNRNLGDLVRLGKFRDDLFYRLKVFTIEVPPLRDRRNDIPALVIHLLKKINNELHKNVRKIPIDVMEMLQSYDWIGNVRELENILYQAVVLSTDDVLQKENILLRKIIPFDTAMDGDLSLSEMEKMHIEHILKKVNFNKTKACSILKISKPTLDSKIRKYNIT